MASVKRVEYKSGRVVYRIAICQGYDVSVYEYVDKEEHDTKLLFSGMLLKEYHVNKDTGEIEEIQ